MKKFQQKKKKKSMKLMSKLIHTKVKVRSRFELRTKPIGIEPTLKTIAL